MKSLIFINAEMAIFIGKVLRYFVIGWLILFSISMLAQPHDPRIALFYFILFKIISLITFIIALFLLHQSFSKHLKPDHFIDWFGALYVLFFVFVLFELFPSILELLNGKTPDWQGTWQVISLILLPFTR